jgi:HK97 family phage portal protein
MPFNFETAMAGLRSVKDMSGQWYAVMGIDRNAPGQYGSVSDFAKAPADEAWVYRCVSIKASFAQSVPLVVDSMITAPAISLPGQPTRAAVRTWLPAVDTTDGAAQDLQALLDDVNPVNMSGADLKAWTIAARAVWGESHWKKVRGKLGGAPQEIYWLRSVDLAPVMGRVWIDKYNYRPQGTGTLPEEIESRNVVPFRTVNLQDQTHGLSPLSGSRFEISVNRMAAEWNAAVLANDGVPSMYWQIPKESEVTDQDESLIRRTIRQLKGPKNARKAVMMPAGIEPKILSLLPRDADWIASRKVSRMTICAAQGVPLVLAGDDDKNTVYGNVRDAERIFARSMIQELDWVTDGINSWLVPDFNPVPVSKRTIRVRADYSEIEALQAPLEQRKQIALQELEKGVRTPNEYRRAFRIGPDFPKGDEAYISTRLAPDPLDVAPPTTTEPEVSEDEGEMVGDPAADTADPTAGPIAADTVRELRGLYKLPAVRAYIADPSRPVPTLEVLGFDPGPTVTSLLGVGITRRYSPAQIADGAEGFPGLRGR